MVNIGSLRKTSSKDFLICKGLAIEQNGYKSNFYKKKPKKLTASSIFIGFWLMHQKGKNTLRNWCTQIALSSETIVTEQSLNERINSSAVDLSQLVLRHALNKKVRRKRLVKQKASFGNQLTIFNR